MIHRIASNVQHVAIKYIAVALAFTLLWLCLHLWRNGRKRIQPVPKGRQIGREMLMSVVSLLIFGSVFPIVFALGFGKHTHFYWNPAERGWAYFVLSIFLMMVIQDTYFYWTHRFMHRRSLFRWFHRTHHRSTNTNPWTTYSVSPLEAVVDSGASIVILLVLPVTGLALFIFTWINTAYAVYTHLGYELYPRWLAQHWLGRWINTSVAHNTHHAKARYNYGWYFLFWDRMMGTLDPAYAARYRAAVE